MLNRIPIFIAVLFLAGCDRHHANPLVVRSHNDLTGTWIVIGDDGYFKSTTTIDTNGNYVANAVYKSHWDEILRTNHIEGTFKIQDGLLVDTMLKNRNTNAELPCISRAKIIRFDEQELAVHGSNGTPDGYDAVFQKENN